MRNAQKGVEKVTGSVQQENSVGCQELYSCGSNSEVFQLRQLFFSGGGRTTKPTFAFSCLLFVFDVGDASPLHFMCVSGPNPMYVSCPIEMSHCTPAMEISPSNSTFPVLQRKERTILGKPVHSFVSMTTCDCQFWEKLYKYGWSEDFESV